MNLFPFALAQVESHQQRIKIEHLRPSTSYQFTVVAESQAGISQAMSPISFRTLDRQRPDFLIDTNENETCLDDRTCVISWSVQSDGGAQIVRTEISYAQVKEGFSFRRSSDHPDCRSTRNKVWKMKVPSIQWSLSIHRPRNTNCED